jgi:amino acid permease
MLLESVMKSEVSTLKGVFVFAATIIGAGILALPVAAADAGLFPMILTLVIIGAMSIFSALYIAEAVLATEGVYHLPTLAEKYLGRIGLLAMLARTSGGRRLNCGVPDLVGWFFSLELT